MGIADWKDWSEGWVKERFYIEYIEANVRYYEYVLMRDLLHYEYDWHETIAPLTVSGPKVPEFLEVTQGYDDTSKTNYLWQLIFGMQGQAYLFIELPTDTHRHGIPKMSKPQSNFRRVSHFEEWMSPFQEPTFLTEHWMKKPALDRINLEAYNPLSISLVPGDDGFKLNFFINALVTERVGQVVSGSSTPTPTSRRWTDVLNKLWAHQIPCRPITLYPVRAPAESQH